MNAGRGAGALSVLVRTFGRRLIRVQVPVHACRSGNSDRDWQHRPREADYPRSLGEVPGSWEQ